MIKRGIFLLMIFPLCLVLFNNTANRHQHLLPDGIVIEHAHPFQSYCTGSDKEKEHQHTDRELLLYTILTDSPVLVSSTDLSTDVFRFKEPDHIVLQPEKSLIKKPVSLSLLRAPPC